MAGRIPESFIDDLVSATDIVEIIEHYVPLKRAGKEFKACCPFHDEKTPSFTVVPDKQFYHCFGCGAHGTAVGFLMDYANMEFVEAVEELARRSGREVPREGGGERGPREDLEPVFIALERANAYFQRQLRRHPRASRAVEYLKGRGLSGRIAAEFQLGFAPPGRTGCCGSSASTTPRAPRSCGRACSSSATAIAPTTGSATGSSSPSTMPGGASPASAPGSSTAASRSTSTLRRRRCSGKAASLYGLWRARRAGRSPARLLVVEGYMDVVALAQSGIGYAVATLGTAATRSPRPASVSRRQRRRVLLRRRRGGPARGMARGGEHASVDEGRPPGVVPLSPRGRGPDSLVRTERQRRVREPSRRCAAVEPVLFDHLAAGGGSGHGGRRRTLPRSSPPPPRADPGRPVSASARGADRRAVCRPGACRSVSAPD